MTRTYLPALVAVPRERNDITESFASWKVPVADAISDTSPLLYLYRIGAVDWLASCSIKWVPPPP